MDNLTKQKLASKHKLGLSLSDLENVEFLYCDDQKNLLQVDGTIAVFKEPIYLAKDIRLSPLYPNIGVSEEGNIFDRFSLEKMEIKIPHDSTQYPFVLNPWRAFESLKNIYVHRCTASAWCINPNPRINFIVNHLDGIKTNSSASNLEWTTHSGNITHAFENGLIDTARRCLVLDLLTKTVTSHSSMSEAARYIGVDQANVSYHLARNDNDPKIISERYEIKYETDPTPWTFNDISQLPSKGRFRVDVTYPDGKIETYWNLIDFGNKFNIKGTKRNAGELVFTVGRHYPELHFQLIERRPRKIFQVLNTETNEITETSDIPTIESMTMKSESFIRKIGNDDKTGLAGIFAIRVKSDEPWKIPEVNSFRRIKARVTNTLNGLSQIFTSISTIAKETNISKPTVRRCLAVNGTFRNFKFELLEDNHS